MHLVLAAVGDEVEVSVLDAHRAVQDVRRMPRAALPGYVAEREQRAQPRWVWDDTRAWYPALLAEGVRVERCVDLRLCHAILRRAAATASSAIATAEAGPWDEEPPRVTAHPGALFELETPGAGAPRDPVREFALQRDAVDASPDPSALSLLLAAESAGALVAAELTHAGLPWRADVHDALLTEALGRRTPGGRPERLESLLVAMRDAFDAPHLNPDSPVELLRDLRAAGLAVESTRSSELKRQRHPGIAPLLEYKKLSRLLTANGWTWLDTWVRDGRFRPVYVPGGVVTGRWASDGGGALQLPHEVRDAVRPDPGWRLVVADAAQLEPRVLAAMSGDRAMADAGRGEDMYDGIVATGAVRSREEAKYGMLGAMYGGTTGPSARVMPNLARTFPRAIGFVEDAARAGERGESVTTRLGRTSPRPSERWFEQQRAASGEEAGPALTERARSEARSWGRFTRNFVVQGTAAEWALCWMAELRNRLWRMGSGRLEERPHLVFFLHDEVVVHAPQELAEAVAAEVQAAAAQAGRVLFGEAPVEFRVTTAVVESYADAK